MHRSLKLLGPIGVLLLIQFVSPSLADTMTPFATVGFAIPSDIHIPVFDIQFSNGYSASFALDTEATQSLVSDTVATMLRLKLRPAVFDDGSPIKTDGVQLQMSEATGIRIGDSAGFNMFLVVFKHQNMTAGVDGVLGLNFLNSFSTLLDFGKGNLSFWYKTSLDASERSRLGLLNEPTKSVDVQVSIGDQNFGVAQLLVIKRKDLPLDADGIIGCNLLSASSTLFDYGNNTVTLWFGGSPTPEERVKLGLAGALTVPTSLVEPCAFTVHARYNDSIEDDLVVDTGANVSQVSQGIARRLKLQPVELVGRARIFGGTEMVNTSVLNRLDVGGLVAKDLKVQYAAQGGATVVKPCIGLDVLSHYRVLIDAPNHLIYFKALGN